MKLKVGALAALSALSLVSGAASAEDRWNHAGLYAGLTAGYSTAQLSTPGTDFATTGAQGGLYLGYGIVGKSGIYVGVEADGVLKDIKWSTGATGSNASATNEWVGSARVRVGQALGPMLLYVTGGAALTDTKVSIAGLGSDSDLRVGWVAGGGIEAQITRTVALRFEGLHYAFPDKNFSFSSLGSEKLGAAETVARVGVSFRLN